MPFTPPNGGHGGGPIEYWERPPYTERFNLDGGEVTRTCLVDWHHARDFPAAMLGDAKCNGVRIDRKLPDMHPHGSKNLYATDCQLVNGLGAWTSDPSNGLIFFNDLINTLPGKAEFKVTYRQLPFDVLPNGLGSNEYPELHRWVIKEFKWNMESYQLPGVAFVWGNAVVGLDEADIQAFNRSAAGQLARGFKPKLQTIPEGMSKQRPLVELTYTRVWVPEPIPLALFEVVGKVNINPFPGIKDGDSFDAGSLLCLPPTIAERKWTPAGTPVRNIVIHLAWRPDSGWNFFYHAGLNAFVDVLTRKASLGKEPDATKRNPYEEDSFGVLFQC